MTKHRVWISIGAVVSVLALGVSALAYVQSADPSEAKLSIAAVTVEAPDPISATEVAIGTREESPYDGLYTATPIDITVQNSGGTPLRITRVTAGPQRTADWVCARIGGGITISADYSIQLPTKDEGGSGADSEQASKAVDFVVRPGSSDRMAVTVGPDRKRGSWMPYVIVATLTLHADNGQTVATQPIALVTLGGIDEQLAEFEKPWRRSEALSRDCLVDYLRDVEAMISAGTVRSPEFDRWIDGLEQIRQT